MMEIVLGLCGGVTLGLCVGPIWMMLQLPMRVTDVCDAGTMRMAGWALVSGAVAGALGGSLPLPMLCGSAALMIGGVFVGMMAGALVEAVEVVPILSDRLRITADMRFAAVALALGKTAGAVLAGLMGG